MSELSYIQIERRPDAIAIITINRPEVLNAINVDVITELSSVIDTVSADDSIKVVIITGRGERSFCAGADIRYVVNINSIEAEKYASSVHTMLNKMENLEKPVIAAINGYALGGGGRRTSTSAKTVHRRLTRMRDNNVLRFFILCNPAYTLGYIQFVLIVN